MRKTLIVAGLVGALSSAMPVQTRGEGKALPEQEPESRTLQEVLVTAPAKTRVELLPLDVTVLSDSVIVHSTESSLLPVLTDRVAGLFTSERGFAGYGVSGGAAGTVNIRGVGQGNKVLFMIDGQPQWASVFGHALPDTYVANGIERVEVVKGPSSLLYGSNAMGGSVNIITRKATRDGLYGRARAMFGSFNTQKFNLASGYRRGRFSIAAAGQLDRSNGNRSGSAFWLANEMVNLGYELSGNWSAGATVTMTQTHADTVTAAQELVSKKVSIVLGSYGSGVSIAAAPTFQSASIPAIGCSCTNPAVTEANPYYFRVCFLDPFQGSVMANFAKDEFSAANAYVLSMLGEDYGSGLATYFVNAFEDLGGTVTSEQFPEGTSDFSAYIQNAINAGADVIFAPCATTYAAQIITQAASAGFDKPITAGDTWESSVILDAQKGTSVQVYCSTFFDENDDSGAAKEFVTGFKEWLNADSQKLTNNGGNDIVAAVSALGYDGYMVALEAIKAAGSTDGTAIRDALYGVNYDGVTGNITFDQTTGDANKDMAYIKKAADGAFEFVKTQSVEG